MSEETREQTREQTATAGCCAGPDFAACCEQMKSMMQNFCGGQKGGWGPTAMMAKMKTEVTDKE